MRIIAGPNGSGKTYLTKWLQNNSDFQFGYYVNADELEARLRQGMPIGFNKYGLHAITHKTLQEFYDTHVLHEKGSAKFTVRSNQLVLDEILPEQTYFGTLLSDFIRQQSLDRNLSFTFEMVMSGSDKMRLLEQATAAGYRVYLYFVCTEDPIINIDRVADRVLKQGHHVPDSLVIERYSKTLTNLIAATAMSYRTYMFDNSGIGPKLICEVFQGKEVKLNRDFIPGWFRKFYLDRL